MKGALILFFGMPMATLIADKRKQTLKSHSFRHNGLANINSGSAVIGFFADPVELTVEQGCFVRTCLPGFDPERIIVQFSGER